jgi:hypothetical protein
MNDIKLILENANINNSGQKNPDNQIKENRSAGTKPILNLYTGENIYGVILIYEK